MTGMAEDKNSYLNKLVQRAMEGKEFGTPTKEEGQSRARSVRTAVWDSAEGGGPIPHTECRYGSPQSSEGQTAAEQTNKDQSSGHAIGQHTSSNRVGSTAEGQSAAGQKASGKNGGNSFLKGLMTGTVISDSLILKDIKYSAMILILGIIFIANRFNAERVEREIAVLEQEVRDMRAEALSVSADLGSVSRQSEITDLVKERGLGLEELREPPYRIVVNE